jgi:cell division protein FtsB
MREFQDRRRTRRFLHSRYAIAILIILCLFLARATYGVYQKYEKSKDIAERMKGDLATLTARQASLQNAINDLNTEEGRDREMRERFGVVKEGEKMIVLVDDNASNSSPVIPLNQGWWSKFLEILGL